MSEHAKWLRKAAAEIAADGHYGWGNTCDEAADALDAQAQEIARLTAELADERQSREINRAVATAALDERDALRARLADAERDAERLDWLCRNRMACLDGEAFSYADSVGDLRQWIDAARGAA